jgi:hypothetical protein
MQQCIGCKGVFGFLFRPHLAVSRLAHALPSLPRKSCKSSCCLLSRHAGPHPPAARRGCDLRILQSMALAFSCFPISYRRRICFLFWDWIAARIHHSVVLRANPGAGQVMMYSFILFCFIPRGLLYNFFRCRYS